ncbi:hypothetical protein JCM10908_004562 [Rhodotorula pacifica]|uniref:calcium channel protein CCH1 n=1 Tax=Rhodotorula pacifica TaxID=1495444 RepID=UPI0031793BD6
MSEQPVAGPSGTRGGTIDTTTTDWAYASRSEGNRAGGAGLVEEPQTYRDEQDGQQVRGWMHFRSTTPTRSSTFDTTSSRRTDTIELCDGTLVRRLPSTPLRRLASSDSTSTAHEQPDDPFRASSDLSSMRGTLFAHDPGVPYSPRRLPNRSDSDPQSLISTIPGDDEGPAESAYDLSTFGSREMDDFDENDEELAARSPLQPAAAGSSLLSTGAAQRASSRPYLAPISTSPSRLGRRKSDDATHARLRDRSPETASGGWAQLTPTRSAEAGLVASQQQQQQQASSPLAGLARRDTLTAAMKRIRRISVRVVNLHDDNRVDEEDQDETAHATEQHQPAPPSPASLHHPPSIHTIDTLPSKERDDQSTIELESVRDGSSHARPEASYRQLRGRTLGIFGPEHRLRRACAAVLTADWTEPVILLLIILQVIVQTIRSSYSVYTHPRPTKGYFHTWEDVVLFVIFCAFTVEIFARIIVTGLIINPPRPVAPLDVKSNPYGTPSRTPSIVTRIQSHLSPLRSHSSAQRSASPTPSRASAADTQPGLTVPTSLASPEELSPAVAFRPSATVYPPSTAKAPSVPDVIAADYGAPRTPTAQINNPFSDDRHVAGHLHPLERSPAYSVKTGLASSLSVATAPAEGNYAASSIHGSTGTGPGPFAYNYAPYALSIKRQRQTYQQAFLRHSFNRIDLIAVVSFWISFILAMTGAEASHNLWFFRALSVLRATRLLAITAGTQTILQSLKKASPILVNVGFFTVFAMLLFAIVGVQAFSESYKRYCVWVDPQGLLPNVTSSQNCGGYFVAGSDDPLPYLIEAGFPSPESPKGYLCGAPSVCIETGNPVSGTWSFDNVVAALFQVVVIASANTWTGTMYQMMNADYFISCLYFIAGIIVLNYWMLNLLVAVITSTFADIREQTKHSAFAATVIRHPSQKFDDDRKPQRGWSRTSSVIRLGYRKTRLIWVALILVSICFQANRSFDMSDRADRLADWMEFSITLALDADILIRLFSYLPDWRLFFSRNSNRVDLILAVATTILILPGVFETAAYSWLTVFQIARFYRVILAIPRPRRLLLRVLGTIMGLANMVIFLLLMTFIAALIAVEFFRGIPNPDNDDTGFLTFHQIFDSFLAMYQILSSENWTDITNTILANETGTLQIVLAGIFLAAWMLFSYFILCNMFIAVINENFAIADEEKRARQIAAFVDRSQASTVAPIASWFRRFDPYTYATTRSRGGAATQSEAGEGIVDRKLTASPDGMGASDQEETPPTPDPLRTRFARGMRRIFRPTGLHRVLEYFAAPVPRQEPVTTALHDRDVTYEPEAEALVLSSRHQRQQTIANFITEHPSYDKPLYIFAQSSRIRQLCQKLVDPCSGGERLNGRPANKYAKWTFQGLVFVSIIASIGIAASATPYYRRQYYLSHGHVLVAWYNLAEVLLATVFIFEFFVKVVADGFLFTPNAYLLSIANDIDFFVLLTIIVNISTLLVTKTGDDRFTRSLKAFRALRLINIWPSVRETFYSVLILGASRIFDASLLAVLYIVPYAVWAANVFRGLLYACNDTSVSTKAECVGEYLASPIADWTFIAPRVWSNPSVWSFDTFRSSLLILFEIVSLEGWIDVMESVMNIKGRDLQPEENASQFNALLIVIYNLIGALFILTIFVSVIIESFVRRSGNSLLTTEQRQWQDLRRLIGRQRPARQPARRPKNVLRAWCYERAVDKHGWWTRGVTALYVANVAVLMTQATTTARAHDLYNWLFLGFVAAYTVDVVVRLIGLGFKYFFTNPWNAYDLVVIIGVNISTFPILAGVNNSAFIQLQKVFLVGLVFKLVQRNDSLNQLFKTATAALPTILNIFALWLILFLTFAIFYTEVFGLTRWGPHGTSLANYYSFGSTLVLLALQSTGEGWNQFMHDYTLQWPACTYSPFYLLSDCGSSPWAYTLFIVWNILSMYLFVNLVLGAVVEGFSFAFQDYGKVTRIRRSDMRDFKRVWASFDADRTGYIQRRDVGKFLGRLHGVFELKIYREEWSLSRLQGASYRSERDQHNSPAFVHYLEDRDALSLRRVDLVTLGRLIDSIDVREVAVRRSNFTLAYHEAMHDAEESHKGLSFSKMLLLIAHYRLINDESALQMDELARRRRKRQLIQRRVDNDRVSSFLRMVVLRRRFLAHLEEKRRREYGQVPDINVVEAASSVGVTPTRSGSVDGSSNSFPM